MFKLEAVSKSFGRIRAVQDVSFEVNAGEVVGFLGTNGAGKSTTMRMMSGYLTPDSGRITVNGYDVSLNGIEVKRAIGYLPENAPVYGEMSVGGFLEYCGGLRGLKGKELREATERVIVACRLSDVYRQRIETLSKGYVHRTCLAQALIHDPQGLILDEPTDGLDPVQKRDMQALIRGMGQSKAIVVSTHILEEVEAICTRVIIISRGRLRLDSPLSAVCGHLYDYFTPEEAC